MPEFALFEDTRLGSINDKKPARLTIKEFQNGRFYITSVGGSAKPNYQLMYSLGDDVFLNTFSERLSMWNLRGLHIMTDCEGIDVPGEPPFMTFYRKYNIKTARTVSMSFAGVTLKGYLTELRIQEYNQNGVEGFRFDLSYLALLQNLVDSDTIAGIAAGSVSEQASAGSGSYSEQADSVLRAAATTLFQNQTALPVVRNGLPPIDRLFPR